MKGTFDPENPKEAGYVLGTTLVPVIDVCLRFRTYSASPSSKQPTCSALLRPGLLRLRRPRSPRGSLFMEIARQFVGDNNGRLLASAAHLKKRGNSADVISRAKRQLLAGGFIFETVQGVGRTKRVGTRSLRKAWTSIPRMTVALLCRSFEVHTGHCNSSTEKR